MRFTAYLLLLAAVLAPAQERNPEVNVNEKYKVSAVDLLPSKRYRLSGSLAGDMRRMVGRNFSQETADRLARRIRAELRAHRVLPRVAKGDDPDTVKVEFVVQRWGRSLALSVPELIYHSRQGWSAAVDATQSFGATRLGVGLVSNGDNLVERYAGVRAHFERLSLFTDRARLGFDFESYHQQWNPATLEARSSLPGIYRTRQNFAPVLTVRLSPALEAGAGVSFQRFQTQYPAAHTEAANAATATLRFSERWERPSGARHGLDAGYSLRAATRTLDSDFAYSRHEWNATYTFALDRQRVAAEFVAGELNGRAPWFERFVAGNSRLLRGWNRWELAPLGGDRLAHGTLEYQYRLLRVFYDTGSVWERGRPAKARHSLGLGLQLESGQGREFRKGFTLAVAFPVKDGRAVPVFIAGMNF